MEDQPIYQTRRPKQSFDSYLETQEGKGILGCLVSVLCLLIASVLLIISLLIGIYKTKTNETKTATAQTEQSL
jgi:hypothetical protein